MKNIENFLKEFLGNDCTVYVGEDRVQAQNLSVLVLVVEPHSGNDHKYLLRVSASVSFDRWANSTYFEEFLDTPEEVINCLKDNELHIYKVLLYCLSKDYCELENYD